MRSKIEMRRRVGRLRPYLEPEATDGDGSDSGPDTSLERGEGSRAGLWVLILECVNFPPWGCVSAPAGVASEAMEEC